MADEITNGTSGATGTAPAAGVEQPPEGATPTPEQQTTFQKWLENMDRICEALDCDVADIFEYIPNHQRKTGKNLIAEEHGNRTKPPADRR